MRGFSLIELSIVLVIIGLMVGGVVGGQALVRQARLQNIIREVDSIKTAVNAFKLQYDALPGDFARASDYWGVFNGAVGGVWCDVSGASNGNGDGHWQAWNTPYEGQSAWRHLMLAEIISGNYHGSNMCPMIPGRGPYASKFSDNAGYNLIWHSIFDGFDSAVSYIAFGDGTSWNQQSGIMTAADARNVDLKIDDGRAATGKVIGMRGTDGGSGCTSSGLWGGRNPTYILTDTTKSCFLIFPFE